MKKLLITQLSLLLLLTTTIFAIHFDDDVFSIKGPTTLIKGEEATVTVDYVASQTRDLAVYLKTTTGKKKNYFYKRITVNAGDELENITFTVPNNAPTNATYKYGVYIAPVGGKYSTNLGKAYQQGVKVNDDIAVTDTIKTITDPATLTKGEEATVNFFINTDPNNGSVDTDNDGVYDYEDNCIDVQNANQIDADNDGLGNMCDADFNNDGNVNVADLKILKGAFGTNDLIVDMDSNGIVSFHDLILFKAQFGK